MQPEALTPTTPVRPYKVQSNSTELAALLSRQIDAVEAAQSQVRPRWDKQEGIYYNDPNSVRQSIVKGTVSYPFSIWRIKADKIVSETVAGLLSTDPLVQFIQEGEGGDDHECEDMSRVVQTLLRNAGLEKAFPVACTAGANTNLGAMRLRTLPDEDTEGGVKVELETFNARDFIVYPATSRNLEEAIVVGHRFYQSLREIKEKVATGYYDFGVENAGDDPFEWTRTGGAREIFQNVGVYASKDDEPVECFNLIVKTPDGGREAVVYARTENVVLKIEQYPYSRPWYTYVRYLDTEYTLYTNDSLAYSVQGYSVAYCDLLNAILAGEYLTSYPMIAMFGSAAGLEAEKAIKFMPGEIIRMSNPDGRIEVIALPFDPSGMFTMAQLLEGLIEQVLGISALATSGNIDPNTKATAMNIQANADMRKMGSYLRAAANSIRDLGELAAEFVRLHYRELQISYGSAMAMKDEYNRKQKYRIEVTGQSGDAMPDVMRQKLTTAMELAADPTSEYDKNKVADMVMQTLHLPYDPASLKKDYVSPVMDMAGQLNKAGLDPTAIMQLGMKVFQNELDGNVPGGPADANGIPSDAGMDGLAGGMEEPAQQAIGGIDNGQGFIPAELPTGAN